MSSKKTILIVQDVQTLLKEYFTSQVSNIQQLVEGEESQAFWFVYNSKAYVIRINRLIDGFYKDAYAYQHFASKALPIPEVIVIKHFIDRANGEQLAFCITEKMQGVTLQDVDEVTLQPLLKPTFDIWHTINKVDISDTSGFGSFDATGQGKYQRWQEFLLSNLDSQSYDWNYVAQHVGRPFLNKLMDTFAKLVDHIQFTPEERSLVHGDFGSNNVLTNGKVITAVLDWDNAMYGDALFDVAIAYFWRTWLLCMNVQVTYYEKHLSALPHYHTRLKCYQLRIALDELYDNILHPNMPEIEWCIQRTREILQTY